MPEEPYVTQSGRVREQPTGKILMKNDIFNLLGRPVTDKVTGLSGVATSISFDLTGCVQVLIEPSAEDGIVGDGLWVDSSVITDIGDAVMHPPKFDLCATEALMTALMTADKPSGKL